MDKFRLTLPSVLRDMHEQPKCFERLVDFHKRLLQVPAALLILLTGLVLKWCGAGKYDGDHNLMAWQSVVPPKKSSSAAAMEMRLASHH